MAFEQTSSFPFPSLTDLQMANVAETEDIPPTLNISPASSNAESDKSANASASPLLRTPSDKLSALPFSSPDILSQNRRERRSTFASSINRAYRRSFDGTLSLPMLPRLDHGQPTSSKDGMKTWVPPRELGTRIGSSNHPSREPSTREVNESGQDSPHRRISIDGDRYSLPAMPSVGQAISRITSRESDKQRQLPAHSHEHEEHPRSRSPSQSRATSPLRMLHNWSAGLHRGKTTPEERFIPVDPFKFKSRMSICGIGINNHDLEAGEGSTSSEAYDCEDIVPMRSIRTFFAEVGHFLGDTLPREIYLNFLLRIPAMYFSRVARLFEDADVSRPDIQRMIEHSGGSWRRYPSHPTHAAATLNAEGNATPLKKQAALFPDGATLSAGAISGIGLTAQASIAPAAAMIHMPLPFPDEWTPPLVSPALIRFKHSWEAFIDALLREWKTLNVVSALLASAILTLFQIPEAANDPLTRTFAFLSLICALMSLSYGCIYIVRFGTMRSMFHASRWAEEARRMNTAICWNVWVLLATPAVWMAWAMILFLSAILSFVWRTGSASDPQDRSPRDDRSALGPRVAITSTLLLGMVYLTMIVKTLKRYGSTDALKRDSEQVQPDVGANQRLNNTPGGGQQSAPSKQTHQDENMEMERRGRERERSNTRRVRRREEELEKVHVGSL